MSKTMVAYFSAGGVTAKAAAALAEARPHVEHLRTFELPGILE